MKATAKLRIAAMMALAAAAAPALAQSVMKPGAWEFNSTTTIEAPGQKPQTISLPLKMCLTKEFLAKEPYMNAEFDKEKAAAKGAKCTVANYKRTGDQAEWDMNCDMGGDNKIEMHISNSATATTLKTVMAQKMIRDGSNGKANISMNARFLRAKCSNDMMKP